MVDISEKEIEQVVRFPHLISDERRKMIEQAISCSKPLQELAHFFKEYQQLFHKLHIPSNIQRIIPLSPFRINDRSEQLRYFVLEAQARENAQNSFQTVATLASEEDETLVRILSERGNPQYRIHVLSKRLGPQDLPILSIDGLDTDLVINRDGWGRFTPEVDLENYNWEASSLSVRIPIKRYAVSVSSINDQQQMQSPDVMLCLQQKEGSLLGTIAPGSACTPAISRVLVESTNIEPTIIYPTNNSFSFNISHNPKYEMLNIWLYE